MTTVIFLGLMLSGTFALGISDVFKRKYLKEGINEQAFLTITMFFTGFVLTPLIAILGLPEIKPEFWTAFTATVTLNMISQNLFIKAFRLSEASLIAPLRLIIPIIVIFTGFIFLKEKPSLIGSLGIVITVAGLWLLLFKKPGPSKIDYSGLKNKGVIYGLIGSVLFAISFPFDKLAVVNSSGIFATSTIFMALGTLTFTVNAVLNKGFGKIIAQNFSGQFKQNIVVGILSGLGIALTNQALNYSLVAYASSLKRLQALWTVIIAGKYLKEGETKRRIAATIIMFLGIIISAIWK